jgi:hypothetical protein
LKKLMTHALTPVPPVRERRPEVPEPLAAVLDRLLAKEPDDRYAGPEEVASALAPLATGSDLSAIRCPVAAGFTSTGPSRATDRQKAHEGSTLPLDSTEANAEAPELPAIGEKRMRGWRLLIAIAAAASLILGIVILLFDQDGRLRFAFFSGPGSGHTTPNGDELFAGRQDRAIPPHRPEYVRSLINKADAHVMQGRDIVGRSDLVPAELDKAVREFGEAIACYENAIRADPSLAVACSRKLADAFRQRGAAFFAKKSYDLALAEANQALKVDARFAAAYELRGVVRGKVGELDNAIADLDEAIEIGDPEAPGSYWAHCARGGVRRAKGQFAKAIADYEVGIGTHPHDIFALRELAWLLATCPDPMHRNGLRAVTLAKDACHSSPSDASCLATLAAAHAEAGEFDAAIDWQAKANGKLGADDPGRRGKYAARLEQFRGEEAHTRRIHVPQYVSRRAVKSSQIGRSVCGRQPASEAAHDKSRTGRV